MIRQRGDMMTAGPQKFLEIPDRARLLYSDDAYLTQTVSWHLPCVTRCDRSPWQWGIAGEWATLLVATNRYAYLLTAGSQ